MDPVAPVATAEPAAPAQPAAPATITAERDAANRGDFSSFDKAFTADRQGKTLPDVVVEAKPETPATAASPEPPATVSKRQQEINDRVRQATEAATAQLREEVTRLKAQVEGRTPPKEPAAPAPPSEPEWKRFRTMPDAPKLDAFDGPNALEDHAAAMALFVAKTLATESRTAAAATADDERLYQAQVERVDGFVKQLNEARTADPEFVNKISPEVRTKVRPFAALAPGEPSSPYNIVGEQVYDSPIAPKVLLHLSQHPEELTRLTTLPERYRTLPHDAAVKAHVKFIVAEFAKLEGRLEGAEIPAAPIPAAAIPETISKASPPPPTLGKTGTGNDPKASAVARGDFPSFDKLEMQNERAKRVRA